MIATRAELLALAERCEREKPSHPLDFAIWMAIDPKAQPSGGDWLDYTHSLDAAVTLVPRDRVPYVNIMLRPQDATVSLSGMRSPEIRVIAQTPALALVAASLRARAATMKD